MKIAFAIEHFDPRRGGAEQYTWSLAKWLAARGHEITVFTTHAEQPDFSVEINLLDVPGGSRARWPLRVAAALQAALRGKTFDVVHGANHIWPCDVLRLGGGVHVAFEHHNAMAGPSPARRAIKEFSNRWLPRQRSLRENERHQFDDPARHFIAVSQRVADDMARAYPSCVGRIHVIHNGVDCEKFSPDAIAPRRAAARANAGLRDGEIALLFVSNNFRLKGLHDLIAALPLLPKSGVENFRLLVAGRGKTEPFKRLASLLGVARRIHFLDRDGAMLDHFAAADLLVHPTYYDACANVPIEAAACGLPVILSDMSGINEVMAGNGGVKIISMPCPPDEFARTIASACAPDFRGQARAANRGLALQNRIEKNYERVLALYEEIAAAKRGGRAP